MLNYYSKTLFDGNKLTNLFVSNALSKEEKLFLLNNNKTIRDLRELSSSNYLDSDEKNEIKNILFMIDKLL